MDADERGYRELFLQLPLLGVDSKPSLPSCPSAMIRAIRGQLSAHRQSQVKKGA